MCTGVVAAPTEDPKFGQTGPNFHMQIPEPFEPDEYLRDELGDELFNQYKGMTRQQRLDFLNDPANGFVPPIEPPGELPNVYGS